MKAILISLVKRNGIIVGVFTVCAIAASFAPKCGMTFGFYAALFLLLGLIWANGVLVSHMSRLIAALLTAVLTLAIGGLVVFLTIQAQKLLVK
jgi:hypothetical protein